MNARAPLHRPAAEPTENELRAVWLTVRGRPGWQGTFEDAMKHPVNSRLLVLNAKHPPKALRTGYTAKQPPTVNNAAPALRKPMPACFDRKRAAAGDRDDD